MRQEATSISRAVRPRAGLAIFTVAIAAIALALPAVASAANGGPKITVMTRNVYLGADLSPALLAPTLPGAVDGGGVIVNEVDSTNFAERAVPLAKEIKRSKSDLVGLQEVALWRDQIPSDGGPPEFGLGGTPATNVRYDFLALLLGELSAVGAKYKVVAVQQEFDQELPADLDGSDATGGLFGADLDARLTMRDVILAKKGSSVKPGATDGANFDTVLPLAVGGVLPVEAVRGWVSTDAEIGASGGRKLRFVNTHLEAFHPGIRLAQATELFAAGGPLDTDEQVILVGDLNSGTAARHNIQDAADRLAFSALLNFGMNDNGAIQSCCYSDMFDETQVFDHTVDHVMTKPSLLTKKAFVTGNDSAEITPSGLWPSDHGGVVSTLQLGK